MAKTRRSLDLSFAPAPAGQPRSVWLYGELRAAIVEGRLSSSTRLPSTRDLARQYRVSRGTVVATFERLKSEGYLTSRVGAGTFVAENVRPRKAPIPVSATPPAYIGRAQAEYRVPKPLVGIKRYGPLRPFRVGEIDLRAFPSRLWGSLIFVNLSSMETPSLVHARIGSRLKPIAGGSLLFGQHDVVELR